MGVPLHTWVLFSNFKLAYNLLRRLMALLIAIWQNSLIGKSLLMQTQLKGLSNRRTGATSINAESSRSHSVFTCVVES
ncbi:hypothetical protein Patl1_02099 [Pistacia atlantica]|uniref:Uncharacterized protein n=1 Tax=Pistacia atlantica TaxID=434234 RepID=A0ACC1C4Q3_9ROSI|nr:hypothetical protein Patl1_02099 [Pistacia atlantica]